MQFQQKKSALASVISIFLLVGCGSSSSTPPTDGEINSAITAYLAARNASDTVAVASAQKGDNGITSGLDGQLHYSVSVTINYRAVQPMDAECNRGDVVPTFQKASVTDTYRVHPMGSSRYQTGETLSCVVPLAFDQVKEGWVPSFGQDYLIKR